MKRPADLYRRTQREASPDGLTMGTLLRALGEAVFSAKRDMTAGNREAAHNRLIACQTVLRLLSEAPQPAEGALGEQLTALYAYAEWDLGQANIHQDTKRLDAVAHVLADLRDGFEGVASDAGGGETA